MFELIKSIVYNKSIFTKRMNDKTKPSMDIEIAITGISGRFPESDNVEEFQNNLMEGIDMVTEDDRRWTPGIYGIPKRNGKIKNLTKFDAHFFGIHSKQAEVMDPGLMKLLENTFEAIIDSGTNPGDIYGSNVGVFIGASFSEALHFFSQDANPSGYALLGGTRNMISNRISYVFNFKGPSVSVDAACSSSLSALHEAINSIEKGECDSAIVGGCNLLLDPQTSRMFHKLSMLSEDGKCKCFDESCNGYVRSEACGTIFLQKKSAAKRIYATIVGIGTSTDGYKENGITYPSGNEQKKLLQQVLTKANINPLDISYIEAHSTGTSVGDPEEINALADVYCNGRTGSLLIGSVKSNIGHTEPSSGLCSLIKVLIAMETGIIPGNLHYQTPNKNIPSLIDGRFKVVDKNTKWNGEYAAVNNFGFGGTNAHLILKSNLKIKSNLNVENSMNPVLVPVTGRTEEAVEYFLNKIENLPPDNELISLIHDIHKKHISGHLYGGYTVLGSKTKFREISNLKRNRQVWYILNGMGSQWVGMGREFMVIKPFSEAILKCADVLKRFNIDLLDLLYRADEETLAYALNSGVLIASMQIALIDTLSAIGIVPDGIIGHSAGEITCAYAGGSLTAEETILLAYWRGKCVVDTKLPHGAMAAIGLSREETNLRKPNSCFVACNNAKDSITLSGPVNDVENFVKELNNQGIFAKLVHSCGVAFHSIYVADVAPMLKEKLDQVIPAGRLRSKKWISTAIPESEWNTKRAQECSSEYYVSNFTSPVLFYEATKKIPEDSIVIELGPHCLLLALIKRVVPKSCITVGLVKKGIPDELSYFLGNLGKLFNNGLNLNLDILHEPVSYPVSRGTPMISPMIILDHSVDWKPDGYFNNGSNIGESIVSVDLTNNKYEYIAGHIIDDKIVLPGTGYLAIVWEVFAGLNKIPINNFPVVFEDVHFVRATIMPKNGAVNFLVNIFIGSGKFELCENGTIVAYGYIKVSEGLDVDGSQLDEPEDRLISMELNQNEFYKEFKLRGYQHLDLFKAVLKSDIDGKAGEIEWKNNWVTFMDGILQFHIMYGKSRNLRIPSTIKKMIIDPIKHASIVKDEQKVMLYYNKDIDIVKCGGVEMHALKTSTIIKRSAHSNTLLEHYSFIPYECKQEMFRDDGLTVITQIILENINETNLKIAEILNEKSIEESVTSIISNVFITERYVKVDITTKSDTDEFIKHMNKVGDGTSNNVESEQQSGYFHLIITNGIINKKDKLTNILTGLNKYGYLLTEEKTDSNLSLIKEAKMTLISKIPTKEDTFLFLLKKSTDTWIAPKVIKITQDHYNWIDEAKVAMSDSENNNQKYMIVSEDRYCGILGLFKCIRRESGGDNFRCVIIDQQDVSPFSLTKYKDFLSKDLAVNILKDGIWGTYRHLKLQSEIKSENSEQIYIATVKYGEISSSKWVEAPLTYYKKQDDRELCTVCFASLNFLDIVAVSGQLAIDYVPQYKNSNVYPGIEFAGYDSNGNRVMGITPHSSLATHTMLEFDYKIPVPDHWTLEQAATVPMAYATCYYGLILRGQMKRGESILIHSGAGGVGLAAITLALSMGCEVFTTVGSEYKRLFLKRQFPKLQVDHIGNSRDTSFEKMVKNITKGRGVDLVLNSLTGDKFQASFRCLAYNGRFIEIGKADLVRNAKLGMNEFLKNISVHAIFVSYFHEDFLKKSGDGIRTMQLLKDGIASGVVQPLPSSVFEINQLEQSFRHMTTGKHIGKILIKVRDEHNNMNKITTAVTEIYFDDQKSYIIVGGLGGVGLELANWMITRGAKILILTTKSGITNGYQKLCLKYWKENGVTVIISKENCLTLNSAINLITLANKLAPVGGIFHSALVLRDGYLVEQTKENFEEVCNTKFKSALYLDKASRDYCKQLEYFVVFSSQLCGRGNAESSTYAMANSAMERICEERKSEGLPALAIQWGPIGDVGFVADKVLRDKDREVYGRSPQKIESCLSALNILLNQKYSTVCSSALPEIKEIKKGEEKSLIQEIGKILGLRDIKKVKHEVPLSEYGLDSLMGSEIKQMLERDYDIVLNATQIRNLTFKDITEMESQKFSSNNNNENDEMFSDTGELLLHDLTELVPKQTVVQMNKYNLNNKTIFMIHPIEGFTIFLKDISAHLRYNVWGLQCTVDAPLRSIEELAAYYLKEVRRIQRKGPYYILGYSYGAVTAFEMVKQLEEQNERCELIMVDCSPDYLKTWVNRYLGKCKTDAEKHAVTLAYFSTSLIGDKLIYKQILKEVIDEKEIETQLLKCREMLQFKTDLIKKEFITAASSFYKKILTLTNYHPNFTLKSMITLIKAEQNFIEAETDDYGLQKYCDKKISIHKMNGSHSVIIKGDAGKHIAEIVSALMDK